MQTDQLHRAGDPAWDEKCHARQCRTSLEARRTSPAQVCAIVFVPKLTALNGSDMFRSLVIIAFANYSLAVVATQVLLYLARGSLWARYLVSW